MDEGVEYKDEAEDISDDDEEDFLSKYTANIIINKEAYTSTSFMLLIHLLFSIKASVDIN